MKESKPSRSHWLHIRLTEDEKQFLLTQSKATTCRNTSDYARLVLLKKPVIYRVRNQSQDELLTEITQLRNELKAIGTNLNQMTRKLHALSVIADIRQWIQHFHTDKQSLLEPLKEIDTEVKKLVRKWLPS